MPYSPASILVVDDNPATRYSTRVLRSAGFSVLEASTGQQALDLATGEVDLVVLDVNLPDLDGFEICRRLRAREETARTPVIHLSATFTTDVYKVHGFEAGANGYLTHPVEPPVLVATVNAFLRTRQTESALRNSEAKFKAVFDRAMNGIALLNKDLVYLEVNPAMCLFLGRTAEQIEGRGMFAFAPAERVPDALATTRELELRGAWRGEFPLNRPDDQLIYLEWNVARHSAPDRWLAIVSDVTARVKAEREREDLLASERAARTEAERANRLKDDFLATLSHELRTPLHAIVGWSQLLKLGGLDQKETAEGVDSIERNAKIQAQMIADLLDVSRITSGKMRLDVQRVDPEGIIEAAIGSVLPAADAKGIRFVKRLASGAGPISADPSRLQQVVSNLLNNAVKFTPRGGIVEVKLQRVAEQVEIAIADNGSGIAPELLPFIFDRFRQGASPASSGQSGGLGLGLAIAKQLVEMHGGTIHAASGGEGKGAEFTVLLPLSPDHRFYDRRTSRAAPPTAPVPYVKESRTRLDGVRILLVDDNNDSRHLTKRVLADSGAELHAASSAAEALTVIEQLKPHVLVSDLGMPDQDGFEFIRQLRAQGYSHQKLPAIALTAFARTEDRRRALLAGFQMHLSKPVDPAELTVAIASLLGRIGGGAEPVSPLRES